MDKESVKKLGEGLSKIFSSNPMVVFLCGPSLDDKNPKPGAILRRKLHELLKQKGFEVVLGEDEGLERLREKYLQMAHLNEAAFVKDGCGAIVLIADSVGSYCELGLFSYIQTDISHKTDFILVIDEQYAPGKLPVTSYLNEGPAKAVESHGKVVYAKLDEYDGVEILERLQNRRAIFLFREQGKSLG